MNKENSTNDVFNNFVDSINEHNIRKINMLMTDDFIFFDAWGRETKGKNKMKNEWKIYFKMFPDYRIEINEIYVNSNKIAAFGFAEGTFENIKTATNEYYWRVPAAFQAEIIEEKIKFWQVCADQKSVFDVINKLIKKIT